MTDEVATEIATQGEIASTIRDVGLLLEFLGQRADSRLQAHFEDTRGELSAPTRKLATPPCRTYKHFLSRFAAIEDRLRSPPMDDRRGDRPLCHLVQATTTRSIDRPARATEAAPVPAGSPPEGDEQLTDRAFLYFSRDFLAAVAAPATVGSIRVTRAYIAARRYSLLSHLWRRPQRNGSPATASLSDGDCARSARRLASRVVLTEWFASAGPP